MASSKRRPGKQKRYRQNRQEREARQARSAHAGEATAISRSEQRAAAKSAKAEGSGGKKGKGKSGRARRPSPYTIPGQRAVLMAFLFTIVAAGTLLFAPVQVQRDVQPDDPRVETTQPDLNDDGTVTIYEDVKLLDEEGPAVAAGIMLTPILITGAAVWFTKRPQRSNAWTMAMVALAGFIFLFAGPYGIIALPSLIALAVGGFQSRRAENKERMAQIKADREARKAGKGDVIDVEPVDEGEDAGDRHG